MIPDKFIPRIIPKLPRGYAQSAAETAAEVTVPFWENRSDLFSQNSAAESAAETAAEFLCYGPNT